MPNTRIPYSFVGDYFLFAVYCSIVYCIQLSQMIPWLHQSTKYSITRGVQLSKIYEYIIYFYFICMLYKQYALFDHCQYVRTPVFIRTVQQTVNVLIKMHGSM